MNNSIAKKLSFYQGKKIRIDLKKIIQQLHLIFHFFFSRKNKKLNKPILQNTIQRKKWIDLVNDVLCRITNSGENAIISNEYKHYLAGKISTLLRKKLEI